MEIVNSGSSAFSKPAKRLRHGLYQNDRNGRFTEVTEKAGVTADLFGMGTAAADYDADGDQNLLVTGYGRSILYRNTDRSSRWRNQPAPHLLSLCFKRYMEILAGLKQRVS